MVRTLTCVLFVFACGGDETEPLPPSTNPCATGQLPHPSGNGCAAVGIQGCAEGFVEEDGLCHPSIDKCAPGTIPSFSEGCIPVGIPNCAPEFVEGDGLCHPTMDKCAEGTFAVPTVGCVPIDGDGCGSGTWGNIADAPDTIWVDPSYSGGDGDGSMLKPMSSIAAAFALVMPGGRIALAAGDYDEAVAIDVPVELVGRCPSMVTIRGTQLVAGFPVVVSVDSAVGVRLSGLRLRDGVGLVASGGEIELQRVHIATAVGWGAVSIGGKLSMERTLVEGTLPESTTSQFGFGIDVENGGELVLHQSALVGNRSVAVYLSKPMTKAVVSESLIQGTLPAVADNEMGRAIQIQEGSTVEVRSSAIVENRDWALFTVLPSSSATVIESIIGRGRPLAGDVFRGSGIAILDGANLNMAASVLTESRGISLWASDPGTNVTLSRNLFTKTLPELSDGSDGRGIEVINGASLQLESSAVVENREIGLVSSSFAASSPTLVSITKSLFEHTLPEENSGAYGVGLLCSGVVQLELSDSAVRDSRTAGVLLGAGATSAISRSLIEQVLPGSFYTYLDGTILEKYDGIGDGVVVAFDGTANIADTLVRSADRAGMIFESSRGVLRGVHSLESRFGLILQGEPRPEWQDGSNRFEGREQAIVTQGSVPVPGAPPLPE